MTAGSADLAVDLAWKAYKPDHAWPLEVKLPGPDREGWTKIAKYGYQTSPNEKRVVAADVRFANDTWTVAIVDVARATAEKRGAQLGVIFGKLLPRGSARESFAGTGMPRQDFEWLFEWKGLTPERALDALGKMQPTSKFGELFQYSNPLAAAAGFIGGHVAFPRLELGAAYDEAMRTRVFDPLGMKATTFDFKRAQTGDFAVAHAQDLDGKTVRALDAINRAVIPERPAGGAWSTVRDMLRYVQMELAEGKLPDGKPYVSKEALLARRAPQIAIGTDITYGMGLMVNRKYGVTVVSHGGDLLGFHSDMMWLPEHGVGAVVLTNGADGTLIRSVFQRKLLEVLFDGRAEADALVAAGKKQIEEQRAATRKLIEVPANAAEAGKLAARYASAELGELVVKRKGAALVFDFGEFATEMASQKNPDGSVSFVMIAPGIIGLPLVAGTSAGGKRTLVLRDAQHEYVFEEKEK